MSIQKQLPTTDGSARRIITPITGALSLVIGISGVMLFFHLGEGLVKELHEWLGMAFALVILLHLTLNWKAFKQHFTKTPAWIGTSIVTAASVVLLSSSLFTQHENPMHSVIHSVETAAISDLAPIFKISPAEMVQRLSQAGVAVETGRETLQELAGKSGVETRRLIASLAAESGPNANARRSLAD